MQAQVRRFLLFWALLVAVSAIPLYAQTFGEVTGHISDASGAAVPAAQPSQTSRRMPCGGRHSKALRSAQPPVLHGEGRREQPASELQGHLFRSDTGDVHGRLRRIRHDDLRPEYRGKRRHILESGCVYRSSSRTVRQCRAQRNPRSGDYRIRRRNTQAIPPTLNILSGAARPGLPSTAAHQNFGVVAGTAGSMRQIQLGLKYSF